MPDPFGSLANIRPARILTSRAISSFEFHGFEFTWFEFTWFEFPGFELPWSGKPSVPCALRVDLCAIRTEAVAHRPKLLTPDADSDLREANDRDSGAYNGLFRHRCERDSDLKHFAFRLERERNRT